MAGLEGSWSPPIEDQIMVDLHLSGGFAVDIWADINYQNAFNEAIQVFEDMAYALVPVRTGYLASTISADSSGKTIFFHATADYASYVEDGTWKMPAQSFFWPSVQLATYAFTLAYNAAVRVAVAELHDRVDGYDMAEGSIAALHSQIEGVADRYYI